MRIYIYTYYLIFHYNIYYIYEKLLKRIFNKNIYYKFKLSSINQYKTNMGYY